MTFLTQIAPVVVEAVSGFGPQNRINNLASSFAGVRVMVWGIPISGAVMNPASSLGGLAWWLLRVKPETYGLAAITATMVSVMFLYVGGALLGGFLGGIVEGVWIMVSTPPSSTRSGFVVDDSHAPHSPNTKVVSKRAATTPSSPSLSKKEQ